MRLLFFINFGKLFFPHSILLSLILLHYHLFPFFLPSVASLSGHSKLLIAAAQGGWCEEIPRLLSTSSDAAEKTLEASADLKRTRVAHIDKNQ